MNVNSAKIESDSDNLPEEDWELVGKEGSSISQESSSKMSFRGNLSKTKIFPQSSKADKVANPLVLDDVNTPTWLHCYHAISTNMVAPDQLKRIYETISKNKCDSPLLRLAVYKAYQQKFDHYPSGFQDDVGSMKTKCVTKVDVLKDHAKSDYRLHLTDCNNDYEKAVLTYYFMKDSNVSCQFIFSLYNDEIEDKIEVLTHNMKVITQTTSLDSILKRVDVVFETMCIVVNSVPKSKSSDTLRKWLDEVSPLIDKYREYRSATPNQTHMDRIKAVVRALKKSLINDPSWLELSGIEYSTVQIQSEKFPTLMTELEETIDSHFD